MLTHILAEGTLYLAVMIIAVSATVGIRFLVNLGINACFYLCLFVVSGYIIRPTLRNLLDA